MREVRNRGSQRRERTPLAAARCPFPPFRLVAVEAPKQAPPVDSQAGSSATKPQAEAGRRGGVLAVAGGLGSG